MKKFDNIADWYDEILKITDDIVEWNTGDEVINQFCDPDLDLKEAVAWVGNTEVGNWSEIEGQGVIYYGRAANCGVIVNDPDCL